MGCETVDDFRYKVNFQTNDLKYALIRRIIFGAIFGT
jgi:hypothetical protein